MNWELIESECLLDKDNYYIINFINHAEEMSNVRDMSTKNDIEPSSCESVYSFMTKLHNSYKNLNQINKQFRVDYPRIVCHVNNIRLKNSYRFLTEFKHTKLLMCAKLLCTQSTFFPIFSILYDKYTQPFDDIHFSDYSDDNHVAVDFKIYSEKKMHVTLKKNFRIIKLIDGDISVLKIISVKIIIMFGKNKYIRYCISECSEF